MQIITHPRFTKATREDSGKAVPTAAYINPPALVPRGVVFYQQRGRREEKKEAAPRVRARPQDSMSVPLALFHPCRERAEGERKDVDQLVLKIYKTL